MYACNRILFAFLTAHLAVARSGPEARDLTYLSKKGYDCIKSAPECLN